MIDLGRILSSDQLPTLPSVAARLLELRRDPNSELKDFIAALRLDPAISAKLLKLANSSHYGVRTPVATIDRAIPLLGTTVVTSMALGFYLSDAAIGTGPLA
jgi:HD-like signal output (HDOD) protein